MGGKFKTIRATACLLVFLLLSGCAEMAFDQVDNSLEDKNPAVTILSSEEIRDEIEYFAEKLAERKIQPCSAARG